MRRFVAILLFLPVSIGATQEKDYAKPILDKAVKAMGSAKKQAKLQGLSFQAKMTIEPNKDTKITADAAWSVQGRDKFRADLTVNLPNGQSLSVVAVVAGGKNHWFQDLNNNKKQKVPDQIVRSLLADLRALRLAQRPVYLRDKSFKMSPLGEMKIDGKDTVGLKISQKGHTDVDLYFDKKSGLPYRVSLRVKENKAGTEAVHSFTLSKYKKIDGIQHCTRIVFHRDKQQMISMDLSAILLQENLGKAIFKQP